MSGVLTIELFRRLRWSILAATYALAASACAASAAEFKLQVPDGATAKQLDDVLRAERAHRKVSPGDAIVIALPARLSRSAAIVLNAEDSGAPNAPLIVRGAPNGGSTISGAAMLDSQGGLDPSAEPVSRMPSAVQKLVRRVKLSGDLAGKVTPAFTANGSFMQSGPGRLFLFDGDKRLAPAPWPASGYATSPVALAAQAPDSLTIQAPQDIPGVDRESDLWMNGFWAWNWWFEKRKVISASGRIVTFAKPKAPVRPGARFKLTNIASGLGRSGLYYRDASDGSVYFIPAKGDGRVDVAVADSLLKVSGASNIKFENVAFEKAIGVAVQINNSDHVVLKDCYVGHTGNSGISINGGHDDVVENCVLDDIGYSAIGVIGGDRKALTPSNHVIRGDYIADFGQEMPTYQPGVRVAGVGVTIEGCEIADASHSGIIFGGNDHRIVGNIFHDLARDANDSGAVYSGRDWTARGTVIASNYFHDITNTLDPSANMGVYLDDELSGTDVEANVFYKVDQPIWVGGGRDNAIRDNLAVASKGSPIGVDARGLNWQAAMVKPGGTLVKSLDAAPYKGGVWASRYPQLVNILNDRPGAPVNNSLSDNIVDQGPLASFDSPDTAAFAAEAGSRQIGAVAFDFPSSLSGVPADAPAAQKLEETRRLIAQTISAMQKLPFRAKLSH